jgi:argininosuccinate lyase
MSDKSDTSKLWGGRFNEPTDSFVQRFTASVNFDQRMANEDIDGSLAHSAMLNRVGILSDEETASIQQGLEQVREEISDGSFVWSIELEDVHMNIEARLTELVGTAGKKLHTGRSRNDQVATDIRLYLRAAIDRTAECNRARLGWRKLMRTSSCPVLRIYRPPSR